MSKQNNLTDKIPFSTFLDTFKEALQNCECEISVCYGSTIIPPDDIRNKIIEENHDSVIGGYRGITKTYRRIREKYFWQEMKDGITDYLRNCTKCQELKLVRIRNREPMIITDTPIEPSAKISIDTVGPLPVTYDGNKHILTVQDNLAKYCIAIAVPNTQDETIADALGRHVITTYGSPRMILSDKAPVKCNNCQKYLKLTK